MKSLLRIFSIALISGAALVSCGKITPTGGNEQGGDTSGTETGGGDEPGGNTDPDVPTRVLAVSFDTKATRTSLYLGDDGYSEARFDAGDVILVANGNATEPCTVYHRNGVAMIQTSLQGVLQAVYPEDAAVVENNRIVGVKVPYEQTGLFADANICMVDEIPIDATKVTFLNQTAIFAVTVPANTDQIEVTSLNVISGDLDQSHNDYGFRTDSKTMINNDEESDNYSIIVKPKSGDNWSMNNTSGDEDDPYACNSVYYVSVLTTRDYFEQSKNVRLIDLNFDVISKPDGDSGDIVRKMGGFSPKLLIKGMQLTIGQTASYNVFAQASSLYVLPYSSLHDYKIVDGLKWATMNVGASSPSDPGYYFPWAGVDEHQYINGKWTEDEVYQFIGFDTDWGFDDTSGPYYDGSGPYYKYYNVDGVTSLALWDDAAYMNWGGAWRTPTTSDFTVLYLTGNNGGLTFPAAGYGQDNSRINYGTSSYYWSSNVDKTNYSNAMIQSFSDDTTSSKERYLGLPIRPVSGVSSVPDDPDINNIDGTLGPIGKSDL